GMKIKLESFQIILITLILSLFLFRNTATHAISDNDASRLAGIISVVRNNALSINNTPFNKIGDRVVYNDVSYSSKPPVLHVLTGLAIKPLFVIKSNYAHNNVVIYKISTVITNILPLILIYICFYLLL